MSVDLIQALQASNINVTNTIEGSGTKPVADFITWLEGQAAEANQQILDADVQLRKLAVGEAENMHQVMMALEKAKMSFQLTLQVRNKVLEAYQDILRMQI